MAITPNPKRNQTEKKEKDAEKFIAGAAKTPAGEDNKKPIMIRIAPDLLERIDAAAKRRGISRSAFIVSSATEKLEEMGS